MASNEPVDYGSRPWSCFRAFGKVPQTSIEVYGGEHDEVCVPTWPMATLGRLFY